ncbi:MAG: RluA family pseudouridine synthase [Bacteroidota bacterium]
MENKIKRESHLVPPRTEAIRLSDYLGGVFQSIPSRKGMKKAIKKQLVFVDGEVASTAKYLYGGETIDLYEEAKKKSTLQLDLGILYEDEDLAVVNKPSGIVVSGNQFRTLENALPNSLEKSTKIDRLAFPKPAHRLDFPTSGVLLVAKTQGTLASLKKQFEAHQIQKVYHAICIGEIPQKGYLKSPIQGKWASTQYEVLERVASSKYGYLNLLEVQILTGRRHQIRIHLSEIGHPILGDVQYGKESLTSSGNGLYLHASSIQFQHPITQVVVSISQMLPKKFKKIFRSLNSWYN